MSTAEKIDSMVEQSRQITYKTFLKYVCFSHLMKVFPFYQGSGLHIKNDYGVSFHKSEYENKPCVYVCHSAIEYIFI